MCLGRGVRSEPDRREPDTRQGGVTGRLVGELIVGEVHFGGRQQDEPQDDGLRLAYEDRRLPVAVDQRGWIVRIGGGIVADVAGELQKHIEAVSRRDVLGCA
jgi:hypothetical protein